MCMGCMSNADFVLTSGILGAASVRAGARQLLPGTFAWTGKVTDDEARAFMASLVPAASAEPPVAPVVPDRVVMPRVLAGR